MLRLGVFGYSEQLQHQIWWRYLQQSHDILNCVLAPRELSYELESGIWKRLQRDVAVGKLDGLIVAADNPERSISMLPVALLGAPVTLRLYWLVDNPPVWDGQRLGPDNNLATLQGGAMDPALIQPDHRHVTAASSTPKMVTLLLRGRADAILSYEDGEAEQLLYAANKAFDSVVIQRVSLYLMLSKRVLAREPWLLDEVQACQRRLMPASELESESAAGSQLNPASSAPNPLPRSAGDRRDLQIPDAQRPVSPAE